MKTNKLDTASGVIMAVELKSIDDINSAEHKEEFGGYNFIGTTGFEDKDKEEMMWEISDGILTMRHIMEFIDKFDHSAFYRIT